jgi:hypothetical protein
MTHSFRLLLVTLSLTAVAAPLLAQEDRPAIGPIVLSHGWLTMGLPRPPVLRSIDC